MKTKTLNQAAVTPYPLTSPDVEKLVRKHLTDEEFQRVKDSDPHVMTCVHWMKERPTAKHYFLGASIAAQKLVSRLVTSAEILSIHTAATGWADYSSNCCLCCSVDFKLPHPDEEEPSQQYALWAQVRKRLRADDAQVLLFTTQLPLTEASATFSFSNKE